MERDCSFGYSCTRVAVIEILFFYRRPPEVFTQSSGTDNVSGGVLNERDVFQSEINYFSLVVADCQGPVSNFLTNTYCSSNDSRDSSSFATDVDEFASILAHVYSAAGIHQQPGQLSRNIHVRSRGAYFARVNVLHPVNAHSQRVRAMSRLDPCQASFLAPFGAALVVFGIVRGWTWCVWHLFHSRYLLRHDRCW